MHIGNKINLLVHSDKKYSKKGLAKHLNKTRQAIYDIIKNPDINTRTLRKIAEYFEVDLSYFIDDSNNFETAQKLNEGLSKYNSSKKYLEDRVDDLDKKVDRLEKDLKKNKS